MKVSLTPSENVKIASVKKASQEQMKILHHLHLPPLRLVAELLLLRREASEEVPLQMRRKCRYEWLEDKRDVQAEE